VSGEEPPYTNFTTGFTGVLDYIWCSSSHIRPLGVAPVPKEDVLLKAGVALPNAQVGFPYGGGRQVQVVGHRDTLMKRETCFYF
jgi:hypothetical protein